MRNDGGFPHFARQARVAAAAEFRYLDRVPAVPGIFSRFWLYRLGKTWAEYTSDPRTMLDMQVQAHKWVLETIPGDLTGVGVHPDFFSIYGESYGFGCELGFDDLTPWIRTHPIQDENDLKKLEATDVSDNRYTQKFREWMAGMQPYLGDYRFRYADGVIRPLPEQLNFGGGTLGIFTLATDLRGPDIYLDLYERPEFARELLRVVTDKVIERYRWLHSMGLGLNSGTALVDDSAGALSPWLYREFVVPCVLRVLDAVGRPLRIHIDAPANHLLPISAFRMKFSPEGMFTSGMVNIPGAKVSLPSRANRSRWGRHSGCRRQNSRTSTTCSMQ